MFEEPSIRFRQLISEARSVITAVAYDQAETTANDMADAIGEMRLAEGKVLGYLEALTVTRPELARSLMADAERFASDWELLCGR